jgi:pilus assembly protein CpaF
MNLAQRLGARRQEPETAIATPGGAPVVPVPIQKLNTAPTTSTLLGQHAAMVPHHSLQRISVGGSSREIANLAAKLHAKVIDRLDVASIASMGASEVRQRISALVDQISAADRISMTDHERELVVSSLFDELLGLGPLEAILSDDSISDILVNGANTIFIEKRGKLLLVDAKFRDDQHLLHTIQRIVSRIGRRIDESSPMVDARLPDGSRVNAIIPPLAVDGPSLSIRRFGSKPFEAGDLLKHGAVNEAMMDYLSQAVRQHCNMLITGGTGAGKTTMLNVLSSFIPHDERIVTIEDSAELRLAQPHVVRLEARPANLEGKGEISIRALVKNSLRMRPDRIVIGEVRGAEVLDMLQAMNTGHDGSLATIHANSTRDAIGRLTTMLGLSGTTLNEETMKTMIGRAVHVIVHVSRFKDGRRRVTGISEIAGQMGSTIQLHDVFVYERSGVAADGTVLGQHKQLARSTIVGVTGDAS